MSNVFSGGVPYAVDVKRLREAWPIDRLEEGVLVPHEELEAVLNLERGTQRYYGVINSWMGKIRTETGIYMVWTPGDGVRVLAPAGILSHAETRTRQKIKQTGRAIRTFAWVQRDRLDEVGQARLDHQQRVAAALKMAIDATRQQLAVELAPARSLPKRSLKAVLAASKREADAESVQ